MADSCYHEDYERQSNLGEMGGGGCRVAQRVFMKVNRWFIAHLQGLAQ